MGLFQKKFTNTSSHAPLYTLGDQKSILIVGLGNPGKEYVGTRHNVGFDAVDNLVTSHSEFDAWITKKDLRCQQTSATIGGTKVIVIKPTTFMNLSGEAVQAVQNFYKISSSNTIVVADELDIPFGQIKTKVGGGSAGHNGIKSIMQHCGENFGRIRIGIDSEQRTKNDEKDFVLKKFSNDEQTNLADLNREVVSILTEYIYSLQLATETRNIIL
jgi:PTH1 family peptidyl-tRNA hydrolase